MDLVDRLKEIAARIIEHGETVETEEATKNAFIMPFISALGYDVFNPKEVIPEYTADVGTKKGEKVDYAIAKAGNIIILMECKKISNDLHKEHASQLYRYFSTTAARFGVLTNGVRYQFFSDIDEANKMDAKPFFEFNLLDFNDAQVDELKKFSKLAFSLTDILNTASTLKYMGGVVKLLEQEFVSPSDEFVRFFASKVYDRSLRQNVMDEFRGIVSRAQQQFINDKITRQFRSAMPDAETSLPSATPIDSVEGGEAAKDGIETTQEELDGFNIVKAILSEVVSLDRVFMRDTKSYFGILLDDNNRKPICRLHFNAKQNYLELGSGRSDQRLAINALNDIFKYKDELKKIVAEYE